jgi:hypothetical protein
MLPASNAQLRTPDSQGVAVCIGCKCTDDHACIDHVFGTPCFWIKVDYKAGIGVCSECDHKIEEYEDRMNKLNGITGSNGSTGEVNPSHMSDTSDKVFPA